MEKDNTLLNNLVLSVSKIESWMNKMEQTVEEGFKIMHEKQDKTNGNVVKNTEFRIGTEANIALIKWVLGFIGVSNIIALILLIIR